jgi:hypothetical protein
LANDSSGHERCRRARPAFNAFNPISRALYRLLEPQDGGSVAVSAEDLLECPSVEQTAATGGGTPTIVTGLRLHTQSGRALQFSSSREPTMRPLTAGDVVLQAPLAAPAPPASPARDEAAAATAAATPAGSDEEQERDGLAVVAVYFPLISVLVPKWLDISYDKTCRQRVYLISGSCTPRDPDADMSDNSTEATAKLIKLFLGLLYPVRATRSLPHACISRGCSEHKKILICATDLCSSLCYQSTLPSADGRPVVSLRCWRWSCSTRRLTSSNTMRTSALCTPSCARGKGSVHPPTEFHVLSIGKTSFGKQLHTAKQRPWSAPLCVNRMETHRRDAALAFGEMWSNCLRTTVTLSDGAAARISAIHASLR